MSDRQVDQHREEDEMICALTADERERLRAGLAALPDTMPPRAVWERIRDQAEAEGLFEARPAYRHWYMGAGLAAAVVLAVLIWPQSGEQSSPEFPVVPPVEVVNGTIVQDLMVQSAQLERDLRSLPDEPLVVRAGTRATILDLEARIAAIDYQLSDPEVQLTPEEEEIFWRERVRLMKSLVGLRYAQTRRAGF